MATPYGDAPKVVFFMRKTTRERRRASDQSQRQRFRHQQYAPPSTLPPSCISVFTAGDGDTRKKNPPPAGYGIAAVTSGGAAVYDMCGQVLAGAAPFQKVKTTTSNLGALVAFAEACEWAWGSTRGRAAAPW